MSRRIDGNGLRTGELARRSYALLTGKSDKEKGRARRQRGTNATDDTPFAVKVRRRWDSAKEKFYRKLHLYSEYEQFPMGLYVDVYL